MKKESKVLLKLLQKLAGIVTEAPPVADEAIIRGPEKSDDFLGKRKHYEAVSFSVRKTISGVCADEA